MSLVFFYCFKRFVSLTLSTNLQLRAIRPVHHRHPIRLGVKPRAISPDSLTGTPITIKYHSGKSGALHFDKRFSDVRVHSLFSCLVIRGTEFLFNLFVKRRNARSISVFYNPCSVWAFHRDNVIFARFEDLLKMEIHFHNDLACEQDLQLEREDFSCLVKVEQLFG